MACGLRGTRPRPQACRLRWGRRESEGHPKRAPALVRGRGQTRGTGTGRCGKASIEASEGINDMPRGDIAFKDWKLTEAQIRQRESFFKQAGLTWWLLLAIDEQTGAGVGFTEVEFNPSDPHAIQQEGTAVVAAHRGRGIGLWLKAVMLGRILAQRPDSHFIRTGNANVNAQMLAINEKLGFTYAWQSTLWQLPMADARKALAGAEAPARA